MIQQLHYGVDSSGFGIVGAVDQALDAGMHHGARAHSAGLNGDEQLAVSETVIPDAGTGLAQGDDFGVRRGVGGGYVMVPSLAYDLSVADYDCSDRDFACFERTLGGAQGFLHP
jgi:hypothetical protein